MVMTSNLSYSEYAAWCRSRFPPVDAGPGPDSSANTVACTEQDSEQCPVTIRSLDNNYVVVTPKSRGSR